MIVKQMLPIAARAAQADLQRFCNEMAMTRQEKQATRMFVVIMVVLMVGLAIHAWYEDRNWRTVLIPIVFGIVGIPLGIFKGRYLLRSLIGENRK